MNLTSPQEDGQGLANFNLGRKDWQQSTSADRINPMNQENTNTTPATTIIGTIMVIGVVVLGYFLFFSKKDTWKGFYYPDESNLDDYIDSPVFGSLDECRNWVNTQVYRYNPDGYGYDYECGKNCRLKEGFTSLVCEETVH